MTEVYQFQQDMLISLIRFLREKTAQQRDVLLRNKQELEELKRLRKYVMLPRRAAIFDMFKGLPRTFVRRMNNCAYMLV